MGWFESIALFFFSAVSSQHDLAALEAMQASFLVDQVLL